MIPIIVILVVLWLLGVITKYTVGGLLHILLVIAVIMLLINVIRGRGICTLPEFVGSAPITREGQARLQGRVRARLLASASR